MKISKKLRNFSFKENLHISERFFALRDRQIPFQANLNFLKNKIITNNFPVFLIVVITIGIFLIPQNAHASLFDFLDPLNWIGAVVNYILGVGFSLMAAGTGFFIMLVNVLLTIIAFFMRMFTEASILLSFNYPYTEMTSGIDPETRKPLLTAVGAGWTVIRDLANMGLVVVLVVIGVGTMLNLSQGKLKSRLLWFFIVALLINFTPLLTGIVIDFSNIIANVFWQSAKNFSSAYIGTNPFVTVADGSQDIVNILVDGVTGKFDILKYMSVMIMFMLSVVMNIILIFVFILLAALFLGRTIALILLVILSPLAFLAIILPSTKKHFSRWWNAFLQWSIIIIPMVFFLWLAGGFLNSVESQCAVGGNVETTIKKAFKVDPNTDLAKALKNTEALEDPDNPSANYACGMFMMFLATGTILIGIGVSLKSSAEGSRIITSRAKTVKDKTIKWASKKTKETTARKGRDIGAKWLAEKGQSWAQSGPGKRKYIGAPLRALKDTMQQPMLKWQKEYKTYEAKLRGQSFDAIKSGMYAEDSRGAASWNYMAKEYPEKLTELIDEETAKGGPNKLLETYKFLVKRGDIRGDDSMKLLGTRMIEETADARAEKTRTVSTTNSETGEEEKVKKSFIDEKKFAEESEKLAKKVNPNDLAHISAASLANETIVGALEKQGKLTRNALEKLAQSPERAAELDETITENYRTEIKNMKDDQRRKIFEEKNAKNGDVFVGGKLGEILHPANVEKMLRMFVKYKKDNKQSTQYMKIISDNPGLAAIHGAAKSGKRTIEGVEKDIKDYRKEQKDYRKKQDEKS